MNIKQFLNQDQKKDLLRFLTAGSVDDGKSTLIGRLLFDSKKLYEDHLAALKRDSKREGHAGGEIDYALLLDGLKAEREQGITIDVAYRYFSTNKRKFIIADTPGHEQYTRNTITGGSTANLAIILVDARQGVITQTKRHTFLVSLLGIKHIVVAINKMDLVDYKREAFDKIVDDYNEFVTSLGIPDINFIPLSALKGDNVVDISDKMPWYHGKSMLEFLETVQVTSDKNFEDLRYPVQYVIRPDLKYRGFAGKIASGIIRKGDEIMVLPSRQKAKVKSIDILNGSLEYAFPPQSVSVTLDREIDVSRGEMLVHPNNLPRIERHFEAMLVWMDEKPMNPYTQFYIKQTTNNTKARIDKIRHKIDVNTLEKTETDHFELNEIGHVVITTVKPFFFDPYKKNHNTGSFVLIDPVTNNTVAVGLILDKVSSERSLKITSEDTQKIVKGEGLIKTIEREKRYNQKATTLWITGLHGSGKNELAYTLEKKLFNTGATTILLDGKSIRSGLSKELDFSPADRAEHLRRVAYICKMLNDQGIITICSFISPNEDIRNQVAEIIGKDKFNLIYLKSNLEFAKKNDKYGLYKLAEEGKLKYLPGVDEPFEEPAKANIVVKAEKNGKNVDGILDYLIKKKII
ncbi:MAG: sulfate adenylyltransferase subunit CysN [Bacteroidales bacterium]|nr:sulfate adenylyltransferase subunit CysN [Bacteroidales bacterium]